jgi:hypothetical protein
MKLRAFAAGLLMAALSLGPATAQDQLNIINDPAEPHVNGASPRLRDDPGVQGGKALRIQVRRKGANPWDVAVESPVVQPVKAGDRLLFAFWARLETGADGAASATLPYNGVQLSSAPYTGLFAGPVEIGSEWKLHEVRGQVDKDYAGGTLKATIHLATAEQTVDFGPLFVVDLGPE